VSASSSRAVHALCLLVLVRAAHSAADEPLPPATPCPAEGAVVEVIARKRELWLCQQGTAVAKFQVAMGRGGVDKRRSGDGRTPLGSYALGSPRASVQYGLFIPIEYPTQDQVAQGFTGGQVGIHGPPRGLTEPEYPTTAVDWTRGCIATGMDEDIAIIAEFVRAHQPMLVIR
jgi:murein L,D-transpeptidase YafK